MNLALLYNNVPLIISQIFRQIGKMLHNCAKGKKYHIKIYKFIQDNGNFG
jgi:hypothetical protein